MYTVVFHLQRLMAEAKLKREMQEVASGESKTRKTKVVCSVPVY